MHTNEQTTTTKFLLVVFIYIVAWDLVNMVYYQLPSTQIKVTHAKVHTLDTYICNNVLQTLHELRFNVIVNSCHIYAIVSGA